MPFESDPIAMKLNELFSGEQAYFWDWDDGLRPAEQALVSIWALEQEVYNGGFLQYQHNIGSQNAPVVAQLRKIGQANAATIVERALSLVATHASGANYVRITSLPASVQSELSQCEREFYDCLDELNAALFRYIEKRRDEIDAPDGFWEEARFQ